jgi:hypothetical protein
MPLAAVRFRAPPMSRRILPYEVEAEKRVVGG